MASNSPGSHRLDGSEALQDLLLPYDKQTKELDDSPRLVDGSQNVWVDLSGSLSKRPAVRDSDLGGQTVPAGHRLERVWVYQTLENPAKIYLLGSWLNTSSGKYKMYYIRVGTTSAWTTVGTLREVDNSDRQHEVVVANGLAYIKSYPASGTGEFLGTTVFDGTDASLHYWGLLPPTQAQAAAFTGAPATWDAAANNCTVNYGWRYAYSWKTSTGHISGRSPLKAPAGQGELSGSDTGPFTNRQPEVNVQGLAATAQVPEIVIWRTTDGGGVFGKVATITNTGSGTIQYDDDDHPAGTADPIPDQYLNLSDLAPFSTINSPPPSVVAPEVVGTNEIDPTSNIVEYAGRIWYAIGNILVFSGNEEVANGIPQECFPSGIQGNFARFKNPIRYLISTSAALYIVTDTTVLWMRGQTRQDFYFEPLFDKIGGAEGQNGAASSIRDFACWLTDSNEIALLQGKNLRIISGPLKDELSAAVSSTTEVQLEGHFFEGQGWVVVGLRDTSDSTNSRIWVYDLARGAWNPPWVVPFSAMVSGRVRESDAKRELVIATEDATGARVGHIDFDAFTDQYAGGDSNYAPVIVTNLFRIPAGNHVNQLRRKGHKPELKNLVIERTKYDSDSNPTVQVRFDEFSGAWTTPGGPNAPTPVAQHTSYYELWYDTAVMAQRAQLKITKSADAEKFQLQTMAFLWDSVAGS